MSRFIATVIALTLLMLPATLRAEPSHGIAMHGAPALEAGFTHLPYANPDARKGGRITLGVTGSFDSLNPLVVRGEPVQGIREFVIESLLARSLDEPFTLYPLLARSIEVPADRSSITFNIDPNARFHDGKAVTAEDVVFSMELLREKGRPNHRTYYKKIAAAEVLSPATVRFTFKPAEPLPGLPAPQENTFDREMPMILGLMPVLPKHATSRDDFDKTSLQPLVGSGPYRVLKVDTGRSMIYARDENYWGKDLPVNRGRFNFGEIRYDYFRDASTQFEAFKIGQIDLRGEDDPARWAEQYRIAAVSENRLVKTEFPSALPTGMTGLVFNLRRPVYSDARIRQALIQLFNFEWTNRTLFHNLYKRTQSYFQRSTLAAIGADEIRPASERERELLSPFPGTVRPEILDGTYHFPVSDGTGHNRENARKAFDLLGQAGYRLIDGKLVHPERGQLSFEILGSSSAQERLLSGFIGDLKRLGIDGRLRVVDSAQYQARLKDYDFDMIQYTWPASLSPGNEQLFRWSSAIAGTPGSFNYAGVKNPAADAMIAEMLSATTPDRFLAAVRALDRVLLSGDYVIPLFHAPTQWIAHWQRLKHPAVQPISGYNLDTWWIEEPAPAPSP